MYKILLHYKTGNSFNSYDEEEYLPLEWESLSIAKENLVAIKEHNDMFKKCSSGPKRDEALNEYRNKWWFNREKGKYIDAEYSLNLKADNGNLMKLRAFWCGHFETLKSVKVEIMDDNTEITF